MTFFYCSTACYCGLNLAKSLPCLGKLTHMGLPANEMDTMMDDASVQASEGRHRSGTKGSAIQLPSSFATACSQEAQQEQRGI